MEGEGDKIKSKQASNEIGLYWTGQGDKKVSRLSDHLGVGTYFSYSKTALLNQNHSNVKVVVLNELQSWFWMAMFLKFKTFKKQK